LAVARRDKDATWQLLGAFCRERDWPKPSALYELESGGLHYRTVPPGYTVDWHDPNVRRSLDLAASTVTLLLGVIGDGGLGFDMVTVAIEVAKADIPDTPTVRWAIAKTRRLRAERKIPEGAMKVKAELARLLEAESEKDVEAGQLKDPLKASYLENQLVAWGVWPLTSLN
jgi:hypothetical protein